MIFEGANDLMMEDRRPKIWPAVAAALCVLIIGWAAFAQSVPSNCSGTATNTAAAIVFPTSGETGPSAPSTYLLIINPSASATLWICISKSCTAAANGAGSIALVPVATGGLNGGHWWKGGPEPPARVSIISSASSSPFTCAYQ